MYVSVRKFFTDKAVDVKKAFIEKYASYGDIKIFVDNDKGAEDGRYLIVKAIKQLIIPSLLEMGIIDIDSERFVSDYYAEFLESWLMTCDEVKIQYLKIIEGQKAADAYRTLRRETRDRWSGGGFGVFNSFSRKFDAIAAANSKSELYNSAETKQKLADSIENTVIAMHLSFLLIMEQKGIFNRQDIPFLNNTDESSALLKRQAAVINNMPALDANTVLDTFPEMILINPYNQELYKAVMPITGANDRKIDDLLGYLDNQYDIKSRTIICAGKEIIINDSHKARQLKMLLGKLEDTYQKYKINPEEEKMKLNTMLENAEIPDEFRNVYRAALNNIKNKKEHEEKELKEQEEKNKNGAIIILAIVFIVIILAALSK